MIRDAKTKDAREILGIYAHYVENTAISFEYDVPEMAVMEERINEHGERMLFWSWRRRGISQDMPTAAASETGKPMIEP